MTGAGSAGVSVERSDAVATLGELAGLFATRFLGFVFMTIQVSRTCEELLDDGSEREGWNEGQRADDDDDADEHGDEERRVRRQRAGARRDDLLFHERPRERER